MLKRISLVISVLLFCVLGMTTAGATSVSAATESVAMPSPTPESEKPAKPAAFRPTKDQIKQGQEFLIKEKLYTGEATGVYGESRTAIKAYQKANGLDVNGKFDRATLEKMGIALTDKQKETAGLGGGVQGPILATSVTPSKDTKPPKTTTAATDGPKRPAPFTANKDQITALQKVLIAGKMFAGEANGERSDALKDAVKAYQKANSLKETGGINAATLEKAGIALTDKQKEQVAAQAAYDAAKTPKN